MKRIQDKLFLLPILLTMTIFLSGCLYMVNDECIVYDGRAYNRFYDGKEFVEYYWEVPELQATHSVDVYYGYKEKPKRATKKANAFDDDRLNMFLLDKNGDLYGDIDYDWPTCEKRIIEAISFLNWDKLEYDPLDEDKDFQIDNSSSVSIIQENLIAAGQSKAWESFNDNEVLHKWRIEISFDDFLPTYYYGFLGQLSDGQFCLLGEYQNDIDDSTVIDNKVFLLNSDAQAIIKALVNT